MSRGTINPLDRICADARPASAFFDALAARDDAVCAEAERLDAVDEAAVKDSASSGGADSPAGVVIPPNPPEAPAGHPDLQLDTNLTLAAEMFPQFSKRPK